MRILHVIPSVGLVRGGPSATIRVLTEGLARVGLSVDVATTDDDGDGVLDVPIGEPRVVSGVRYHFFPRQSHFYTFSWPLTTWLWRHVADYDLVHIHALFSYAALPAAFAASRLQVPYIVRPLGVLNQWGMKNRRPWLKKASFRLIERRILKGAAAVHYTSEQERLEAEALGITQPGVIIPNAVIRPEIQLADCRGYLRRRYPSLTGKKVILFLSRLDPKKGLDLLLPAFAQLRTRERDVVLAIAGSGEVEFVKELKRRAGELGVSESVIWMGFLEGDAKWMALSDADVFVLPSYSENFGIVVVEAMASGVPVIVSDQVAIHREISASRAGLVVPCLAEKLADAMMQLVRSQALRDCLVTNSKVLVDREFSIDRVTRDLVETYSTLLRSPPVQACA